RSGGTCGKAPTCYAPICRRTRRGTVVEIHATDRSRGVVSRAQERAFDPAVVPPEGAAGQGPRPGGLSGLCPLGDTEASAKASAGHRSPAFGQRSGQRSAVVADGGA